MTLVRPGMHQSLEPAVELTVEQRIFGELQDVRESLTLIRITLLGGDYRDIRHEGRLPLLDKQIELLHEKDELQSNRIKLLEDDKLGRDATLRAAVGTAKWFGGLIGAVAGACVSALLHIVMHR